MSILTDFFNGKVSPYLNINAYDPDFKPITDQIADERENWLRKRLSEAEYERFEKLEGLYYELIDLWQKKSFNYSFKLGSLLMIEILTGNEELFENSGR